MKDANILWEACIKQMPLIAILRGVKPDEVLAVGQFLVDAGFTSIEVPLNSPRPFQSIELLMREFGDSVIIGAGTVLTVDDVNQTFDTGAKLIIAPNFNDNVARAAQQGGGIYCPGVATPTEAFNALDAGASALKLFPAELVSPVVVKAMRAVLPANTSLFPVGGISPSNMTTYLEAGATGFGIGSALYKPGKSVDAIGTAAQAFVGALKLRPSVGQ